MFTILIVTTAYAILFSAMNGLRFHSIMSVYVAAFITIVGIGQAALFGGRQPRLASVVSGAVAYFIGYLCFIFLEPRWQLGFSVGTAIFASATFGSVLGYIAGVLVGGVFLVADALRQRYGKESGDGTAANASDIAGRPSVHPLDDVPSTSPQ